jgi:hypothetical protein
MLIYRFINLGFEQIEKSIFLPPLYNKQIQTMKLKEIVAIAGVGGLHKIIGRTKNGLILETLAEPKKRFPTGIQDRVSVLDDIAMYTIEGDLRLAEVFVKINGAEKSGKTVPSSKNDSKQQRDFLIETIQLDSERVYDSDVKKLINWYGLLKDLLDFATLLEEDQETAENTATAETEITEKVDSPKAKKSTKSKSADVEASPKVSRKKKSEE